MGNAPFWLLATGFFPLGLPPAEPLLHQRQRTDSLARGRKDCIADRRRNRRQRRFAETCGRIVGLQEMHFDICWSIRHASERVLIEVALHSSSFIERDFCSHY